MFGRDRKKSFDGQKLLKRVQNAQQGFTESWKNVADKAKKEVKIVSKKARKVLATEDGGKYRDEYVLTANLDAGHDLFKYFQNNWSDLHEQSMINVSKAMETDKKVLEFTKTFQRNHTYIEEFYGNLASLPEVMTQVENAQKRLDSIAEQTKKVEELLVIYDDVIERCAFQKKKDELKFRLSQLVETKHAEYNIKKSMVANRQLSSESRDAMENSPIVGESVKKLEEPSSAVTKPAKVENKKEFQRQQSAEKQRAYEDAFLDQMNRYIQYGELDRPISGSVISGEVSIEDDIQIDEDDLSTLKEFLGPEELNSVLEASQFNDTMTSLDTSNIKVLTENSSPSDETANESLENANETSTSSENAKIGFAKSDEKSESLLSNDDVNETADREDTQSYNQTKNDLDSSEDNSFENTNIDTDTVETKSSPSNSENENEKVSADDNTS